MLARAYILGMTLTQWLMLIGVGIELGWWWWADRRLRAMPRERLLRSMLGAFMGAMLVGAGVFVIDPPAVRTYQGIFPKWLLATIYLWHYVVLPIAVIATALAAAAVRFAHWGESARDSRASREPEMSRRRLLGAVAALAPPIVLVPVMAASRWQVGRLRIRRIEVPLASLPPMLDGLTIAQVTDMHVGRFTPPRVMPDLVAAVRELDADLVVHLGDLIDYVLDDLDTALDAVVQMRGRMGSAMIIGNHDMYEDRDEFTRRSRQAGVDLLVDEAMTLPIGDAAVQLLGLDYHADDALMAQSVQRLMAQRQVGQFPILLAHHPHAWDPARAAQLPLTLSGHTHGGQLHISPRVGFGPAVFRYWSGLYQQDGSALVVANGVSSWLPLRSYAPAEIVRLTLRARPGAT
jgi:uncharacterized protein